MSHGDPRLHRSLARRRRLPGRVRVVSRSLRGDDLRAHGGIFKHGAPAVPYATINSSAYYDGTLGQDSSDLAFEVRKLTIVVGATGLLVAGILFNQLLERSQRA